MPVRITPTELPAHNNSEYFRKSSSSVAAISTACHADTQHRKLIVCVAVVERRSVTGELSLSYARPAADG